MWNIIRNLGKEEYNILIEKNYEEYNLERREKISKRPIRVPGRPQEASWGVLNFLSRFIKYI